MHPIEARDLTVVYRSGMLARPVVGLDGLDLALEEGEVFGYIGANGAGKTTTMKALLNLIRPTRGEAFLLGVTTRSPASRREVGFLPEAPYFYEYLTGRETVDFYARLSGVPRDARALRVGEVIERVGLAQAADRPVRTYSRGMRQRLGLAQATVHEPRLLILDEPLAGLDPLGRREVRLLIQEVARGGATVFFSSHILSNVEALCDRVGMLAVGKLVAHGPPDELAAKIGGARVKAVEVRCTGISPDNIAPLAGTASRVRTDGETLTFEVPDEEAANRAARLVLDRGGALRSLAPVKESLEEVFARFEAGRQAAPDARNEQDEGDG